MLVKNCTFDCVVKFPHLHTVAPCNSILSIYLFNFKHLIDVPTKKRQTN